MVSTDLLTITDARRAIRFPDTDISQDNDLTDIYIPAVTEVVEGIIGPVVQRSADEWYDGGTNQIALLQAPISAVTLVEESYGNFTRTLTSQPLNGSSFDAYGYTVDTDTGIVQRRAAGRAIEFPPGRQNVHVTYTAGISANTASVPRDIVLAARLILRSMWTRDQPGRPAVAGGAPPPDSTAAPDGYQIDPRARALLAKRVRLPGIA